MTTAKSENEISYFERLYGEIEEPKVEKTNGLIRRLIEINVELRDLDIPIRVFAKVTQGVKKLSKDNQLYYRHTVDHAINLASDF